jgi:hypothetical protein
MSTPLPRYAASRERLANKVSQQAVRQRRAEEGRPDPALLDRAIADAVRSCLAAAPAGRRLATAINPEAILKASACALLRRSLKAQQAGKQAIVYRPEAVARALAERLGLDP